MSITQDNDQDRPFKKSSFKANQIQERKKKKKWLCISQYPIIL